jgi:thioesterase domain-containing protein
VAPNEGSCDLKLCVARTCNARARLALERVRLEHARMSPLEQQVERYLHEQIPLSVAMGVKVVQASVEHVALSAPLAPNVNHVATVFGGSAVAVATICAWTLLHLKLEQAGLPAGLLIQRSSMEYRKPITGDFEARCTWRNESAWQRFRATLERRARARITLQAQLLLAGTEMGEFQGDFVALKRPIPRAASGPRPLLPDGSPS